MKTFSRTILSVAIFLLPAFLILLLTLFRFTFFSLYTNLIAEDGVFETTQALSYGVAAVFLGVGGWQSWKKHTSVPAVTALILSLGLILVALEEISWGQRIFGFTNPEYFQKNNIQYEVSLHNLATVQPLLHWAYLATGIFLGWGRILFDLAYLKTSKLYVTMRQFLPGPLKMLYFLPTSAIYALLMFYKPFGIILDSGVPVMVGRDQELGELFLALGISLHAWTIYRHLHTYTVKAKRTRLRFPVAVQLEYSK